MLGADGLQLGITPILCVPDWLLDAGFTAPQLVVVLALLRAARDGRPPMTMAEFGSTVGRTASSVRGTIAELEQRGLLTRRASRSQNEPIAIDIAGLLSLAGSGSPPIG